MCTVFYIKDLCLLSKNRDKERQESEEIVQTPELLAVRSVGADYFSLGLNRHGCAFVSTAVNNPLWTRAVEEGRSEDARTLWHVDTTGKVSPTQIVSDKLAAARNINDLVTAIRETDRDLRGYNVVLADPEGAVVLETFGREIHVRPLQPRDVVTNHFQNLPFGPRKLDDYPNSFHRYAHASERVSPIHRLTDLCNVIHPGKSEEPSCLWRGDVFRTISSSILDLSRGHLYYSCGIDVPYRLYRMEMIKACEQSGWIRSNTHDDAIGKVL